MTALRLTVHLVRLQSLVNSGRLSTATSLRMSARLKANVCVMRNREVNAVNAVMLAALMTRANLIQYVQIVTSHT